MNLPAHRYGISLLQTVWLLLLSALTVAAADSSPRTSPDITALRIEYWTAFTGTTTHFFQEQEDGHFSIMTTYQPPGPSKISAPTTGHIPILKAEDLAELTTFLVSPETERAFANLKPVMTTDGELLSVTIFRNGFFQGVSSQFSFEKDTSEPEKKLASLVMRLLGKADALLDEGKAWWHVFVPRVNITAANWGDAMDQFARLKDEDGNEIPCLVYILSTPATGKPLAVSEDGTRMEMVLDKLAAQAGMSVAMAGPVAAVGSDAEVKGFVQAMKLQPPYEGQFQGRILRHVTMKGATLAEVVDFLNHRPTGNDLVPWDSPATLKCLTHQKHIVNFEGSHVPVNDFLSAIAAAVGLPASKLFTESKNEGGVRSAK